MFWEMHTAEIVQEGEPEDNEYVVSTGLLPISTIVGLEGSPGYMYFPGYADYEVVPLLESFACQYVSSQCLIYKIHRSIQH